MEAELFNDVIAFVQASPEVIPQVVMLLDQRLTPKQKESLLSLQPSQSQYSSMLNTIRVRVPQQKLSPQIEQNQRKGFHADRHEERELVLSIIRERHRQVKETHAFVRFFFGICLIVLIASIVLAFFNFATGTVLTVISTFLSAVGGMILKTHSENNQRLNDLLNNMGE